jgi:hypothetical protein
MKLKKARKNKFFLILILTILTKITQELKVIFDICEDIDALYECNYRCD